MDINVTINCPDLLMAATTLAKAFTCRCHAHNESETPQAEAFNAPAPRPYQPQQPRRSQEP